MTFNLPNGNEPSEIILPNGVSASEVKDPLGNTVWSAIPDSVVLQYFATTVSGGDGTWSNDVDGEPDMSLTEGESSATLSDGSPAIAFDGNSDHGLVNMPTSLEGNNLREFSVEMSLDYEHDDTGYFSGVNNSGFDQNLFIEPFTGGQLRVRISDENGGNNLTFEAETNPNLNDGNRHDISVIIKDSTQSDVGLIIDGTSVPVNITEAGNPTNFTSWDYPVAFGARNNNGTVDGHTNVNIGAIRWHDSAISQQTIGDY